MEHRLVLTLHLDAFDLAQGGGWTEYDVDGEQVASEAYPAFSEPDLFPDAALQHLLDRWLAHHARQQALFRQ